MRRANSATVMRLSGLTSMVDPGWDLSALYRGDISGITRHEGVEAFATESWNSGSSFRFSTTLLGFRATMSSRHWGVSDTFLELCKVVEPVGVIICVVVGWEACRGATD